LEELKKVGKMPHDWSIRKSYFDECRSDRYERTVVHLSLHVLRQRLREIKPDLKRRLC
jgi:hypothetical protein